MKIGFKIWYFSAIKLGIRNKMELYANYLVRLCVIVKKKKRKEKKTERMASLFDTRTQTLVLCIIFN